MSHPRFSVTPLSRDRGQHRGAAIAALVLSLLLPACAVQLQRDPATAGSADGQRAAAIAYVAPELQGDLRESIAYMESLGFEGFTAENLPQVRRGSAVHAPEFLPGPAVEERMIPGAPGDPEVRVYVIGASSSKALEGGPDRSRPAILHMHGGGFILGSASGSVPAMQELSARHDAVVVTVDYRLAPETPFPGSLQDNYAALKWLYENADQLGVDRSRIAIMGDSAGGGHAAMLAIAARDRAEVPLALQLLVYPMLDDRTGSTRPVPYWMGYGAWTARENRFGWSSLLGVPAGSDEVPGGAVPAREEDLSGLPPTFIVVGSVDLFVDEDIEYARRLIAAGVPTELLVLPGGYHGFQARSPETVLAQRFNAAIDAALARAFAVPAESTR